MAGFIAKTLLRHATISRSPKAAAAAATIPSVGLSHRHRSSKATKQQQSMEIEREEYEVALKLFDDLIQRNLVKKSTPDWLPFLPGASFWVPPRLSRSKVANLIHKFTNHLTHDEPLSVPTLRGWPSSQEFFIQENESAHGGDTGVEVNNPEGMEVTVQVKVLTIPENVALSEDEEG